MTTDNDFLNRFEARDYAGVTINTIDSWIATGRLAKYEGFRDGFRTFVSAVELDALIQPKAAA